PTNKPKTLENVAILIAQVMATPESWVYVRAAAPGTVIKSIAIIVPVVVASAIKFKTTSVISTNKPELLAHQRNAKIQDRSFLVPKAYKSAPI
ncbi:MAG: hypothetical protein ACKVG1_14425, partial [Rhodospirillales bacterium]